MSGRRFAGASLWVVTATVDRRATGAIQPSFNPIVIECLFGTAAAKLVSAQRLSQPSLGAGASVLAYVMVGGGTEARALFALTIAFLVL